MRALFVRIKCAIAEPYSVAHKLAELEISSGIYSTGRAFEKIVNLYLEYEVELGQYVNTHIHAVGRIRDTETLVAFRAF